MSRLKEKYIKEILPKMKEEFGYKNDLSVPKINKVVVSSGAGKAVLDSGIIDEIVDGFYNITGQKPIVCIAKKSVAAFKLREKMPIGVKVTLRGEVMYNFLDKLVNIVLPRIRDFRGINPSFDSNGNYNLGMREHTVFPEIDYEKVKNVFGLSVSIDTSAKNSEEARRLLRLLGFPFKDK